MMNTSTCRYERLRFINGAVNGVLDDEELTRVLAQVEVTFPNSMIEAFWRSLKHSWLYLHFLESFTALRRLNENRSAACDACVLETSSGALPVQRSRSRMSRDRSRAERHLEQSNRLDHQRRKHAYQRV
jgi:hypothetical protein